MSYSSNYCEATSQLSEDGCFGRPNHEGQHDGWAYNGDGESYRVYWSDPQTTFSQAEASILLTALQPIQQFFPELAKKLELMAART